ncbi:hypothetical protein B0H63DRAFT_477116 [Podospora didyma]|uniref:Uncharacterized protein n=1 Tax=Podospora didyma TaxID=330526 RepID=A0AAE0TWF9_9PEZI|nr:hypothetical protein B0H63DRAFT_477116 [Podospora didyma]
MPSRGRDRACAGLSFTVGGAFGLFDFSPLNLDLEAKPIRSFPFFFGLYLVFASNSILVRVIPVSSS